MVWGTKCKLLTFGVLLVAISRSSGSTSNRYGRGINGGLSCAACTMAVGLVETLAQVHNESITDAVNKACGYLPQLYQIPCKDIIDAYGATVIDLIYAKATPDIVCHATKFCTKDAGQKECNLYPLPKSVHWWTIKNATYEAQHRLEKILGTRDPIVCNLPGIKYICDLVHRIFDGHLPAVDMDTDGYSIIRTLRGTMWRGRDCNDLDPDVHPGTRPKNSDKELDSNCNGIYGVDPLTDVPYEDTLCSKSTIKGVGILGDSAGAHFHIPQEWLLAKELSKDLLTNLPFVLENEFDWPMMSATTGFMNITWPIVRGAVHSLYSMLRDRNLCIHRDYQNIAVNGARSSSMLHIQASLSRNQTADYPMLLTYALVGNDVCNGHPDTLAHMTTPKQMRENFLKTLSYLDTRLPKGSDVMVIGLADGRVLYDNMYKRFHPLGDLNKDITYPQFYDYLSCLQISPCNGWMTSNSTQRDLTFKRVVELNEVLKDVSSKYNSSNFDVIYLDCPLMPVIERWKKKYGPNSGWKLIEPVDGFHPNQYAETLSAQYTWDYLQLYHPDMLGDINPQNDIIRDIFGDQGGY